MGTPVQPAALVNPWDDTPARVPTLLDFGGAALEDETGDRAPLRDGSMPYSDMFNRRAEALASAAAVTPSLVVTVRISAGAPVLDSFVAPRTTLRSEDIGIVDNGTGDCTVRVRADYIPTRRTEPSATPTEGTAPTCSAAEYAATDTGVAYRGARVKSWAAGVAADQGFTLRIF